MAKDLTVSPIERQNILNNRMAIPRIQERLNVEAYQFEGKYYLTKQMVADFYEVTTTVINTLYIRHKEEIDTDGVSKKSLYQIREACFAQDVQGNSEVKIVSGKRGHTTIVFGTKEIVFPNSGGKFFSPSCCSSYWYAPA